MPSPLSVRIPSALLEELDGRVAQEGSDRTAVILRALKEHLGFESSDAPGLHANQQAIQEVVNEHDLKLEDHEQRLTEFERMAERSGVQ